MTILNHSPVFFRCLSFFMLWWTVLSVSAEMLVLRNPMRGDQSAVPMRVSSPPGHTDAVLVDGVPVPSQWEETSAGR